MVGAAQPHLASDALGQARDADDVVVQFAVVLADDAHEHAVDALGGAGAAAALVLVEATVRGL